MQPEALNRHRHDAGFWQRDWDYSTDASVDQAVTTFNSAAQDGVDGSEAAALVKSGSDHDQVTDREARQISAHLRAHYDQMSPEAKRIADHFEATFAPRVGNLHDASDEALSGYQHGGFFGTNLRICFPDAPVLEGADLQAFVGQVDVMSLRFESIGGRDWQEMLSPFLRG